MSQTDPQTDREAIEEADAIVQQAVAFTSEEIYANPVHGRFPPDFADICQRFAQFEYWSIDEAVRLMRGFDPIRPLGLLPAHKAWDDEIAMIAERLARSQFCVKEQDGTSRVQAASALEWGLNEDLCLPRSLVEAMNYTVKSDDCLWAESEAISKTGESHWAIIRNKVRSIAADLWRKSPALRAIEIVRHPEVKGVAGHVPEKTRSKWIKDLDPRPRDKRGGRPRKDSKSTNTLS